MLVFDRPQEVAAWVASQSGLPPPKAEAGIGYLVDGELRAGVHFNLFTVKNIFAHIASVGPIPRELLRAVAGYAYRQLGLKRMTFAVSSGNRKAVQLAERLGAHLETHLHDATGDGHLLLYVLRSTDALPVRLLASKE